MRGATIQLQSAKKSKLRVLHLERERKLVESEEEVRKDVVKLNKRRGLGWR